MGMLFLQINNCGTYKNREFWKDAGYSIQLSLFTDGGKFEKEVGFI